MEYWIFFQVIIDIAFGLPIIFWYQLRMVSDSLDSHMIFDTQVG